MINDLGGRASAGRCNPSVTGGAQMVQDGALEGSLGHCAPPALSSGQKQLTNYCRICASCYYSGTKNQTKERTVRD